MGHFYSKYPVRNSLFQVGRKEKQVSLESWGQGRFPCAVKEETLRRVLYRENALHVGASSVFLTGIIAITKTVEI